MKPSLPSFQDLNQALSETSLKLHASQVHGLISGMICGNPDPNAAWEELVTGEKDSSEKTHRLLQSLFEISASQLDEFLFEFDLLMPADAEGLPIRAEALTLWCQGYLTGLKLAKVQMINRQPGEMTEAINDLIEIAKMNYEEVVANEEDEEAYIELIEYVRMTVILIYQNLREQETANGVSSTSNHLH